MNTTQFSDEQKETLTDSPILNNILAEVPINYEFKNVISQEVAEEMVKKVDKRFELNIDKRKGLERDWTAIVKETINGVQCPPHLDKLIKQYISVGDAQYTVNFRQQHAKANDWLDKDFFRLSADSSTIVDPEILTANTELIKQKIQNPQSNFYNAMSLATLQLSMLNISAVHYQFIKKYETPKKRYTKNIVTSKGSYQMLKIENEEVPQLVYQGGRWEFVNMFNCYPDAESVNFQNISEIDVFYRRGLPFSDARDDQRFDITVPYFNDDRVLFRDNKELQELSKTQVSYQRSDSERMLASNKIDTTDYIENCIEIRNAWIKEIKINEKYYQNLNIQYAKVSGRLIPLLIEENYFDFDQKPILLADDWRNPFDLYSRGVSSLSFNDAKMKTFLKGLEISEVIKITHAPRIFPQSLEKSVQTHDSKDGSKIAKLFDNADQKTIYNDEIYQGQAEVLSLGKRDAMETLPFIQNAIARPEQEQQTYASLLQTHDVSRATATGVNYVSSAEIAQITQYRSRFFSQIIEPSFRFLLNDLKEGDMEEENVILRNNDKTLREMLTKFAQAQNIPIPTNPEEQDVFFSQYSQQLSKQTKEMQTLPEINIPTHLTKDLQMINLRIKLNTYTKETIYALNALNILKANFRLELEDHDYNLDKDAEKFTALYSQIIALLQGSPIHALKLGGIATNHLCTILKTPYKKEIQEQFNDVIKEMLQKEQQMQQQQMQQQQAQSQAIQLDAESNQIKAQSQQANAQSQQMLAQAKLMQQAQEFQQPTL